MVFLQGYGVSPAFAARIYKRYGAHAIARVRENPYRLAFDVWGIGFLSADKLAAALGIGKESDVRVEAGVRHVIQESATNGDVFVPRERLVRQAAALLEVTEKLADGAVDRLARAGDVALDAAVNAGALDAGVAVYDADLYRAERAVAVGLRKLLEGRAASVEVDVPRALAWYEQQAGITLARQQAEAVALALSGKVAVVTGGPGVGKTTIVRAIVSHPWRAKGCASRLAAPTGRAAKRLADQAGGPRRRCTACSSATRRGRRSSATPRARSSATCSSSTRRRCSTCAWPRDLLAAARARDAPRARGRRRSAPVGGAGRASCATSSTRAPCPRCASRRSSARPREPHRHERPPHPRRRAARARARRPGAGDDSATSSSSRRTIPEGRARSCASS